MYSYCLHAFTGKYRGPRGSWFCVSHIFNIRPIHRRYLVLAQLLWFSSRMLDYTDKLSRGQICFLVQHNWCYLAFDKVAQVVFLYGYKCIIQFLIRSNKVHLVTVRRINTTPEGLAEREGFPCSIGKKIKFFSYSPEIIPWDACAAQRLKPIAYLCFFPLRSHKRAPRISN